MTEPYDTASTLATTLLKAIEHAKTFGERAVLLPMDVAESMRMKAEELVVHLAPKSPRKPAKKRT